MARLIIADVDGCISPEESIPWDLDPFVQFARLTRQANDGHGPIAPITFCTGRPQPYVELLAKLLDVRAPVICESGAVLYTLHDNHARYAPGVSVEKIAGLRALRAFIESEILPSQPGALLQFGKEAQISVFSKAPAILPGIQRQVEGFMAGRRGPGLDITRSHYYLNMSLSGVDKGATLRLLLDELGIDGDDAAGIGDTEGDLPIRQVVRFFACPANATAAVQSVADYVSPHPALRGILDILNHPAMRK